MTDPTLEELKSKMDATRAVYADLLAAVGAAEAAFEDACDAYLAIEAEQAGFAKRGPTPASPPSKPSKPRRRPMTDPTLIELDAKRDAAHEAVLKATHEAFDAANDACDETFGAAEDAFDDAWGDFEEARKAAQAGFEAWANTCAAYYGTTKTQEKTDD